MSVKLCIVLMMYLVGSHVGAQNKCPLDSYGVVDMSNIGLTSVDTTTFDTIYDCKSVVENITSLDLSNNKIASVDVDSFAIFFELLNLNMSNNRIAYLDNSTFYPLKKLESLDVSFNSLTKLDGGLISLFKLRSVWFNNNNISKVDPKIVGQENIALRYFNLNNNSLTYLDPWPFTTYQSYQRGLDREFFIQHNKISELTNYMNWTYDLRYPFEVMLNLQWNEIKTITVETLRQYEPNMDRESIFTAFLTYQTNVTHNPFFCDCNLFEMTDIVRGGIFRYTRVEEYRYRCALPSASAGIDFLHDLDYDQFVCNITNDCPSGCFCQDRPFNDTFLIDCNGAGLTEMPDVIPNHRRSKLELILDNNAIVSLKNVSYLTNIYNLSIIGNRVNNLDKDILSAMNATRLNFRNNEIVKLPKEIKKFSYSSVLLSGNPLECDCDSIWLSDWIKLDSEEGDISLTCDSKTGTHTIKDINLKLLGCTNEWIIILCVCLGLILALIAIGLVFKKRCPYETKVLLHKVFGIRQDDYKVTDTDHQKEVDIYIVFDDVCEDVIGWVRYFLKKLNRKKPIYSVLNPARFMEPGGESENIPKWIGRSKRMIIVLSDKIFENEWRCFEIEDAERRIIEATARHNEKNAVKKQTRNNFNDKNTDNNNDDNKGDCRIDIENDNNLMDVEEDTANEHVFNIGGDENLENAPKIIYIIFNSSDLLKSKLDEDKWIERLGDRRNLRKNNPKEFDFKAKAWQEKLQQEPWKSRLAGKVVLSPDDRMFWSKLRYELPPVGNGIGDGNFTFKHPDTQEGTGMRAQSPHLDRNQNDVINNPIKLDRKDNEHKFTNLGNFPEKARVHKTKCKNTKQGKTKGENERKGDLTGKQILDELKVSSSKKGGFSISGYNEPTPKTTGLENSTNTDSNRQLVHLLEDGLDISLRETAETKMSQSEKSEDEKEGLATCSRAKIYKEEQSTSSRPGSGSRNNSVDPRNRIFPIGTKGNGLSEKLTDILGYSNNMRSDNVREMSKNVSSNLNRKMSSNTLSSDIIDMSFSEA